MREQIREAFAQRIGKSGVALVPAGAPPHHNSLHDFRVDSHFYYLTGMEESHCLCLLAPGHAQHHYVLFVRPRDEKSTVWEGQRLGVEGAKEIYGADEAYPWEALAEKLPEYLKGASHLYYRLGEDENLDRLVISVLMQLREKKFEPEAVPVTISDVDHVLQEMRLRKSPQEIACLRKAIEITAQGYQASMEQTAPGLYEYGLEALLSYIYRKSGTRGPGFNTIVASGPNANILHYTRNCRQMLDGDLVLVDSGAEYEFFSADVSRTWPVNGRFSSAQRDLYQAVLATQKETIASVRPGAAFWEIHLDTIRRLTGRMIELKLLQGSVDSLIEEKKHEKFFMHKTGHWLGLDLHDTGTYFVEGKPRLLEPGMVVTVEPGLYVREDPETPSAFWGLGVRIEDDLLVTAEGHEVLTQMIPKEIPDLEASLARRTKGA